MCRGESVCEGPGSNTWILLLMFLASGPSAFAQSVDFLPEMDARFKLKSFMRVYVQAKDDREAGVPHQFAIGPSLQIYLKPLLRLKKLTVFDLDDAKPRVLVLETGYRYITAPDTAPTNRMETVVTFHFPLKAGFLVSDRNRADLDWKAGIFEWRYRNRVTIERTVAVFSYHVIPYIAAEPYYTSQYGSWSTTALYVGCLFPVGKHLQLNSYYMHENNTGKTPNEQRNEIGVALNLYFSLEKK
jgi:hypothetical protein